MGKSNFQARSVVLQSPCSSHFIKLSFLIIMPYYSFTINFKTEKGIRGLRKSSKTPKSIINKDSSLPEAIPYIYSLSSTMHKTFYKGKKKILLQVSTVKNFNSKDRCSNRCTEMCQRKWTSSFTCLAKRFSFLPHLSLLELSSPQARPASLKVAYT